MSKKSLPISSPTAAVEYKTTKSDIERERRYKAEDALSTCQRYGEIKKDKELMRDVKQLAKQKMKELKKVV